MRFSADEYIPMMLPVGVAMIVGLTEHDRRREPRRGCVGHREATRICQLARQRRKR